MTDITAGEVMTPKGMGKFVRYKHGRVDVEHDYMYLANYNGKEVFVKC